MNDVAGPFAGDGFGERLSALVGAGGPVLTVLLVLSIIALAIVLLKVWQFLWVRIGERAFMAEALADWRAGRTDQALQRLEGHRNPAGNVIALAMRGRLEGAKEETVREEVTRVATARLEALRNHLRGLEIIGVLAPLLGLLGTVLGMIDAFRALEAAGPQVDPAALSGGIWEALLTTAAGLSLAIPAVAALVWLERIVDRFRHRMEDAITQVFTHSPGELAEPAGSGEEGRLASLERHRTAHAH